jgi:SAM-dependent methyltransferase
VSVNPSTTSLPAAVRAFDAQASTFDERFGGWRSVQAQRRAVRTELLRCFPARSRLLELGGGTGGDAVYLATRGRTVTLTDGAPRMLAAAAKQIDAHGLTGRVTLHQVMLESLTASTPELLADGGAYDGAYSNFAALNCVTDLAPVARGLASLVRPGGRVALVVFGPLCPGEMVVEILRGRPGAACRRLTRGEVPARLGGEQFSVRYPSPRTIARAFAPAFRLQRTRGIGILVPPSAAEPEISRFPTLLGTLERMDRALSRPLAWLGDHVMMVLVRR